MECEPCSSTTRNLGALTPNEKRRIIDAERERRRMIRYAQVRQQSAMNAQRILEKVRERKRRELAKIRRQLTDAVVRRLSQASVLSPVQINNLSPALSMSGKRKRKGISVEESSRAAQRHSEALKRLKREKELRKVKERALLDRRREAVRLANLRSKENTATTA